MAFTLTGDARYKALHDGKKGLITPDDIQQIVVAYDNQPVTRCELELLLPPSNRGALLKDHGDNIDAFIKKTTGNDERNLALRLSLEAYKYAISPNHDDVSATLERWRRVVAMRQNRVLVPGRAAQIYSQLISTFLGAGEFEFLRQVLQYVGLTPEVYLPTVPGAFIDLNDLCFRIAKITLDIDLLQWQWEEEGRARGEPEPLSPKEKGENIAEWHWKQVPPPGGRPELQYHVTDMTLSVLRVAFAQASDQGLKEITVKLQEGYQSPPSRYYKIEKRGLSFSRPPPWYFCVSMKPPREA